MFVCTTVHIRGAAAKTPDQQMTLWERNLRALEARAPALLPLALVRPQRQIRRLGSKEPGLMSEADQVLTIDVVSDVVCPWCYLGEKRLEEALSEEAGPVVVRWRPYQLDPTIPEGGLDRTEYMEKKFGKSGRLQSAHNNLTRLGAEVGVPFAFDKIKRSPNTLDAHRLIRWAGSAGVQAEVADRLFKAYFVEGRDIGDRKVLVEIASECGLDANEVEKLLADGADADLVRQEIEQAQAMGVSGVPFFIFGGSLGVPGAQEPSVLRQAMAEARQAMAKSADETAESA
jgi:predicted DsbA family dithiol-disulfide isomerase